MPPDKEDLRHVQKSIDKGFGETRKDLRRLFEIQTKHGESIARIEEKQESTKKIHMIMAEDIQENKISAVRAHGMAVDAKAEVLKLDRRNMAAIIVAGTTIAGFIFKVIWDMVKSV